MQPHAGELQWRILLSFWIRSDKGIALDTLSFQPRCTWEVDFITVFKIKFLSITRDISSPHRRSVTVLLHSLRKIWIALTLSDIMLPIGCMKSYQESTNGSRSVGNQTPRAVSCFSTETVSARLREVNGEAARKGVAISISRPKYLHAFLPLCWITLRFLLPCTALREENDCCGLGKTQLAVRMT